MVLDFLMNAFFSSLDRFPAGNTPHFCTGISKRFLQWSWKRLLKSQRKKNGTADFSFMKRLWHPKSEKREDILWQQIPSEKAISAFRPAVPSAECLPKTVTGSAARLLSAR